MKKRNCWPGNLWLNYESELIKYLSEQIQIQGNIIKYNNYFEWISNAAENKESEQYYVTDKSKDRIIKKVVLNRDQSLEILSSVILDFILWMALQQHVYCYVNFDVFLIVLYYLFILFHSNAIARFFFTF